MSFPKYPEYKDSGVEWLGEVPAHWNHGKVRYFAKLESGHTPSRNKPEYWENCTIPWFTLSDVWQIRSGLTKVVYETKEKVSELGLANSSARLLPAGTVILSRTASVGYSAILGKPMATTQDFANWICGKKVSPEYLLAAFRAMVSEFSRMMMGSTHKTIYMPDIAELYCAIPPIHEQSKIVAFLDHETARIDALVEEQQRLIELLTEKRQAVISHAVTKGLDPDVPMKGSGVEWLGEVPAHWEVLSLRRVTDLIQTGGTPSTYQPSGEIEGGIDWFTPGDFGESLVLGRSMRKVKSSPTDSGEVRVFPSDSVYLVGIGATLGKVGYAAKAASANQQINVLVPCSKVYGYFLAYSMSVKKEAMRVVSNASTIGIINQEKTKGLMVAVPPAEEQSLIMDYLDDFVSKNSELIKQAEQGVSLLQERRSALISAAVTGKIDVRGWQPPTRSSIPTEASRTEVV